MSAAGIRAANGGKPAAQFGDKLALSLVRIETRVTYPCDLFAEQPQRIMDRTCSDEFNCVLLDKSACPMHLQQIRTQLLN